MKDPIMLCPVCSGRVQRMRKKHGFRCVNPTCGKFEQAVISDTEVNQLKVAICAEESEALIEWARSKNPKGAGWRVCQTSQTSIEHSSAVHATVVL